MPPVRHQIPLRVGLTDEASFENFYSGHTANSNLLNHLQAGTPDLVYLYGTAHSGVSHLLIAISKQAERLGQRTQYIPLKELLDAPAAMLSQLDSLDLLCLDDIDSVARLDDWQLEIFHLFNRLREQGAGIVFGGHLVPAELQIDLADLRSRILSGQTWAISELDDVDKLVVLKKRATLRGFNLSDAVAKYLLGREQRDMSNLMKRLDQLDRLSLQEKKLVTLPMVKKVIENQEAI